MLSLFYQVGKYVWKRYFDAGTDNSEDEVALPEDQENYIMSIAHNPPIECIGQITSLDCNGGFINTNIRFTIELNPHLQLKLNDKVVFIIENSGEYGERNAKIIHKIISSKYNTIEKYAKVIKTEGRNIITDIENVRFNLDKVKKDFIPIRGDFMLLSIKISIDSTSTVNANEKLLEVVEVSSIKYNIKDGCITFLNDNKKQGVINNEIYFSTVTCKYSHTAKLGYRVSCTAIMSDQGRFSKRAITMQCRPSVQLITIPIEVRNTLGVTLSDCVDICLPFTNKKLIRINIKNNTNQPQIFHMCVISCKSLLKKTSKKNNDMLIMPKKVITLTMECFGKSRGTFEEKVWFCFTNFKIARIFRISVIDSSCNYINISKNDLQNLHNHNEVSYISCVRTSAPSNSMYAYEIPDRMWKIKYFCQNNLADVFISDVIRQPLNRYNYTEKLHLLLYYEEVETQFMYQQYENNKTFLINSGEYLVLVIEGVIDKEIPLQINGFVKVNNPWAADCGSFKGQIHKICNNKVYMRFSQSFHEKYRGEGLDIKFYFSRSAFLKCHSAIDLAYTNLGPRILFPTSVVAIQDPQLTIEEEEGVPYVITESIVMENNRSVVNLRRQRMIWYDRNLDAVQKKAVLNVLRGRLRPLPYVIFGPPGSGKTNTLVEIILQILSLVPGAKMLIGAPSTSSANVLAQRLINLGDCYPPCVMRFIANRQLIEENVPTDLKPFCATLNISMNNRRAPKHYINFKGERLPYSETDITITIGTCISLASLTEVNFPVGHFTHILVDDAGRCLEPEIMAVLSFANVMKTQIILSGDPLQLGPIVMSRTAAKFGLNTSYLERLMNCPPYERNIISHGIENDGYNNSLITGLTYNYRSLQMIVDLSSDLFYDGKLKSLVRPNSMRNILYDMLIRTAVSLPNNPGIMFYGVEGENIRDQGSRSWYNEIEVSEILQFLHQLYENKIKDDDIGIISPYSQQVKLLRAEMIHRGMKIPKVGSIEEFQGQERKIILLSTVRSEMEYFDIDLVRDLGFVNEPKRVNVAITRAQLLLVIFGNPHLLCADPLWRAIIKRVVREYHYRGCDLPDLNELEADDDD